MSSTALKILALFMVVLALIAAAIAYRIGQNYSRQARAAEAARQSTQVETPKTLAVVATTPLLAFEPIPRDAVAVVPVEIAPAGVFASVQDVENRVPMVDIDPGTPLTARYFQGDSQMARIIPENHKGMSVEINDVIAVGGFIRPGDIVDVLLFVRGSGSNAASQARTLLRAVSVLGYDDRILDRPEGAPTGAAAQQRRSRTRTAVLAVPDEDVARLLLGDSVGELRLALHAAAAEDAAPQFDDGGLPLLTPEESDVPQEDAEDDLGAPITMEELTALAQQDKAEDQPPPPPPPVYVYRGDDVSAVRP